jgi:Flp pilus assembly protein TadD
LGAGHRDTLAAMHNLAATLALQGELVEARALYERALAGWEEEEEQQMTTPADWSIEAFAAANNLGALLHEQWDLEAAEALLERSSEESTRRR